MNENERMRLERQLQQERFDEYCRQKYRNEDVPLTISQSILYGAIILAGVVTTILILF